jgi:hypothetical protein
MPSGTERSPIPGQGFREPDEAEEDSSFPPPAALLGWRLWAAAVGGIVFVALIIIALALG